MKSLIRFVIASAFLGFSLQAGIINVPADQPDIQSGIDAAANGDTVLVADGTYIENINFMGKAITVASYFLTDGDTSHIYATIIDGSQPSYPLLGSVVTFDSGEDNTSVLAGFTITGGSGTVIGNGTRHGGGIYIVNSTATIRNNIIEFNSINQPTDAYGGGIYAAFLLNQDLIIENNLIRHNSITSTNVTEYCLGGGIYTYSDGNETVRISNNRIINNTITAPVAYGGGIEPGAANFLITNNIIKGNSINATQGGAGGGIDVFDYVPVIQNNLIIGNSAPTGGGIVFEFTSSAAKTTGMGGRGAGKPAANAALKTNLTNPLNVSNNTIVGNSAAVRGGGVDIIGSTIPAAMSLIVWGNTAPSDPQISGIMDLQYSDIEGGYLGTANIETDPLFADTTFYYLLSNSPCIDGGNLDPVYNDPEDPLNPGFARWPAQSLLFNDMGAYGGPGSKTLIDNLVGIEEIPISSGNLPAGFQLFQNYPNPFNPGTTIEFALTYSGRVTLKVYNVLGQEVAVLASENMLAGKYKYDWDAGGLASGVYYYRLDAHPAASSGRGFSQTKKLLLLK